MIPTEIIEIFGTISVGGLAFFLILKYIWIIKAGQDTFKEWCISLSWRPKSNQGFLIFIFFVFSIGIVVQDLTDRLTDSEYQSFFQDKYYSQYWWPPCIQNKILIDEGTHRFTSLFKLGKNKKTEQNQEHKIMYKYTGLGKNVFAHKSFIQFIFDQQYLNQAVSGGGEEEKFKELKQFIEKGPAYLYQSKKFEDCKDIVIQFVNNLYYHAKNWAYRQENYFNELESIQHRIDFSRSLFHIASWFIVILVLPIVFILPFSAFNRFIKQVWPKNHKFECLSKYSILFRERNYYQHSFNIIGIMIIICFVSLMGYTHSERMFNERAFGYYISFLDENHFNNKLEIDTSQIDMPPPDPSQVGLTDPSINANLWMQNAAEYQAICRQTFNIAERQIAELKEKESSDKPDAIVMDLDETVLENSKYQSYLVLNATTYSSDSWKQWVTNHADEVTLVPGSKEFIEKIRGMGIDVLFISNRKETERESTIQTLLHLGLITRETLNEKPIRLQLRQDTNSKESRMQTAREHYHVLAYLGDNLCDMDSEFEIGTETTIQSRSLLVERNRSKFGTHWFVLPNPVYGDWMTLIDNDPPVEKHLHTTKSGSL